jgi:hypothetical protein
MEVYFARKSQTINGCPVLRLDVIDQFLKTGYFGMLKMYPDLTCIFVIEPDRFEQVYGDDLPCLDPQIAQIMEGLKATAGQE